MCHIVAQPSLSTLQSTDFAHSPPSLPPLCPPLIYPPIYPPSCPFMSLKVSAEVAGIRQEYDEAKRDEAWEQASRRSHLFEAVERDDKGYIEKMVMEGVCKDVNCTNTFGVRLLEHAFKHCAIGKKDEEIERRKEGRKR